MSRTARSASAATSDAGAGAPGSSLQLDETLSLSAAERQAALDLKVARYMFYGGFAALPWLWFVVWVHFRKVAREPHASPMLAVYARRSLIGSVLGGTLLLSWAITASLSWRSWGEAGRAIMLVAPDGGEGLEL